MMSETSVIAIAANAQRMWRRQIDAASSTFVEFSGSRVRTRMLSYMMLTHATVSSMKPGITADLVIGTCVLIAIAFVVFWLFDKDG